MRHVWYFFALIAVGCGNSNNAITPSTSSSTSELPPFETWITYDSPDAPYSIALPKSPTAKALNVGGLDKPLQLRMCQLSSTLVLSTNGSDIPARINVYNEKEYRRIMDASMNDEVSNMKATLLDQKTFLYQGKYPTREYTASVVEPSVGKGIIRARTTLIPGKLLQHMIVAKEDTIKKPEVTQFLDSVKIKSN